jgi:hypothetical protein
VILYELLSAVGANPRAAVFSIPVKINHNINAILPHQPCYINIAHLQHVIIDINSRNNTLLKAIAFFRTEPIEKNLKPASIMHLQHFGQQDHDGVLVYIGREIPNTHAIRFCCSFGGKRQWCKTVLALRMDFAAYQMPFRRVFQWQQPKRCCVWTGKPKRGNNIRVKGAPVTQMDHLVQYF